MEVLGKNDTRPMSQEFDPYHRWLGISRKHQPPNHYRLLGLETFESNPEVIRDAAERQMAHVRSYQLGPHRDLSQRILNELAAAKACLLDAETKTTYDAGLRGTTPVSPAGDPLPMQEGVSPTHETGPSKTPSAPPARMEPSSAFPTIHGHHHLTPVEDEGPSWSSVRAALRQPTVRSDRPKPRGGNSSLGSYRRLTSLSRRRSSTGFATQLKRLIPTRLDALLEDMAGEGNSIVHNFLRCCAIASPAVVLLVLLVVAFAFRGSLSSVDRFFALSASPATGGVPAGAAVEIGTGTKSSLIAAREPEADGHSVGRSDAADTSRTEKESPPLLIGSISEPAKRLGDLTASSPGIGADQLVPNLPPEEGPLGWREDAVPDSIALPNAASDANSLIENSIGMRLALVPKGSFMMGSPESEAGRELSEVRHLVRLTRHFYLGVYEVTQSEYERVMGTNPSGFVSLSVDDRSRFPVEHVSWEDAVEFCRKLSELPAERSLGRVYRLPTEAEWEYACRAGSTTPYHFGMQLNGEGANCNGSFPYGTTLTGVYLKQPAAVGAYAANSFGLGEMHGNVLEWCSDWYAEDYYTKSPESDPTGPTAGSRRVVRGGSWSDNASVCRSSARYGMDPAYRGDDVGFRVAFQLP